MRATPEPALGGKSGKFNWLLCHQPNSTDWRARCAKPHALGRLDDALFVEACCVMNQIIALV